MIQFNIFKKIVFVFFILSSVTTTAQVVKLGLQGGFNITEPLFVYPSDSSQFYSASSYNTNSNGSTTPVLKNHPSYMPFFGYFGGVFLKYQPDRLANGWKFFVEIEKRSFKTSLTPYIDPISGYTVYPTTRDLYSNTYLTQGVLYVIQQSEKFEIGVGLSNHILINSFYINPYGTTTLGTDKIKNNQFKPDMLSLPLQGTYNFGNAFTYATIDIPIMNSIRFGPANFKCFQTILQVGIGAYIRVVDR